MTLKNKLRKAGAIGLAILVGAMPLKAQSIDDVDYSFNLRSPYVGDLSFIHNGKRHRLIDRNMDDKPDELITGDYRFPVSPDIIEQKYGEIYRSEKRELIEGYAIKFRNAIRNKQGKLKVNKSQLLFDKYPTIEAELNGDDGITYTAIDDTKHQGTETFRVTTKDGKYYTLYINGDESAKTKELIGDLADFAVKSQMPNLPDF